MGLLHFCLNFFYHLALQSHTRDPTHFSPGYSRQEFALSLLYSVDIAYLYSLLFKSDLMVYPPIRSLLLIFIRISLLVTEYYTPSFLELLKEHFKVWPNKFSTCCFDLVYFESASFTAEFSYSLCKCSVQFRPNHNDSCLKGHYTAR